MLVEYLEQRAQEPIGPEHTGRRDLHDRDAALVRDRLDRFRPDVRLRSDEGSGIVRYVRVTDPDRDAPIHRRLDGPRVEDLGSEVGELGSLGVRQTWDRARAR